MLLCGMYALKLATWPTPLLSCLPCCSLAGLPTHLTWVSHCCLGAVLPLIWVSPLLQIGRHIGWCLAARRQPARLLCCCLASPAAAAHAIGAASAVLVQSARCSCR